jgi:hypothetical protein
MPRSEVPISASILADQADQHHYRATFWLT